MRELKFKAYLKRVDEPYSVYWFDLMWGNHGRGNGYVGMVPWGEEQSKPGKYRGNMVLIDPMDCDIMQFTGLRDKNGVEIFEGDIIRHIQGEQEKPESEFECLGIVRFSRGAFYIDTKNARRQTLYLHDIDGIGQITHRWEATLHRQFVYELAKDFEVVGNIFQNHELLTPIQS